MKFSSLYNNPLSQSTYNNNLNNNKIRVNRDITKVFSPTSNLRINNSKLSNKSKNSTNKSKIKNLKNNNILTSPNYLKDVNYIKYININVDIDKIQHIQIWWKYIYKIIILQKNIRAFIVKKKAKQKLKNYKLISNILKICFSPFFNNIQLCYKKYYFKKWREIIDKSLIYNKILFNKKLSQNAKELLNINKSFQNNVTKDKDKENNNKSITLGNIKKMVFSNNSSLFQDKFLSPYREESTSAKPINIQINIKKSKNASCSLYTKQDYSSLNKSLNNKSISKKNTSNKRSKSNNKVISNIDNHSFHFDEKTQALTNNLYQNIKEYYNINEININPAVSTINFYPSKINKNNTNNPKKLKKTININNNNNNSNKFKKKTIISNKKNNNKGNFNDFYKNNKMESWIPYQHTFGNLKTNSININNNYKKNCNKITHSTFISPASNSNRNAKRNKNRSLEFDDNDINSIKFLLKFKRTFLHWKNLIIRKKIIKKLRLISKIKYIINIYKILYIKLFFSKMIQNIYKNAFYQNKINFNYIILNQYYSKLKEISKKKKLLNDINIKYNNKRTKIKDKINKTKIYDNKNKKNNNLNFNTESNAATGLYYATQFNQKFNKLLNDKKAKNNNIIIINNNINNNCQQLINNVKQNKNKGNNINNYYRKTVNNNSMIDIQPTDTSLSYTVDLINQSDKSLNSLLINQISEKQKNLINTKNKIYYLNKVFKIIDNNKNKSVLHDYLNQWKTKVILKKCNLNKNIIDEKIIHFPKSPSSNTNTNTHNNYSNINNYSYNYMNSYNYTYNNHTNNNNFNNNMNYSYNNSDLMLHTMLTENNIKNAKNIFGNNASLLRNKMFTPSNKFSFYTQYHNNDSNNNINYINSRPRETEPKIVYHKKLFPSFGSTNFKQNNNTFFIDYNYNKEDRNNISFNNNMTNINNMSNNMTNNMNMNNIHYGKNIISNFYSSNNFFNRRTNYHLDNIDNILPEEKYGFKKINKIEEREISFSPSLSRKNHSFKNVIKDNYQNINNNNIYINVVENFRSDYQNQNINNLNGVKRCNYGNNYRPINRSLTEEDNLNKLMCHSHSQGFTKTIQSLFGTS